MERKGSEWTAQAAQSDLLFEDTFSQMDRPEPSRTSVPQLKISNDRRAVSHTVSLRTELVSVNCSDQFLTC